MESEAPPKEDVKNHIASADSAIVSDVSPVEVGLAEADTIGAGLSQQRILTIFAAANIILILSAILIMRGPWHELTRLRQTQQLMESRLQIMQTNAAQWSENKAALSDWETEQANQAALFIDYGQIADALAAVSQEAQRYDLREQSYTVGEPVVRSGSPSSGTVIYEIQASAVFEGTYENLCEFLRRLTADAGIYQVDRLLMSTAGIGEAANVQITFTLLAEE